MKHIWTYFSYAFVCSIKLPKQRWPPPRSSSARPFGFARRWRSLARLHAHPLPRYMHPCMCACQSTDAADPNEFVSTAGFETLLKRMKEGKMLMDEFSNFIKQRAIIEDTYGRALVRLAKTTAASLEVGCVACIWWQANQPTDFHLLLLLVCRTLRSSWDTLRNGKACRYGGR